MGLIADFRNRKEIDAFGHWMGDQMLRRLPAQDVPNEKKRVAEIEITLGHAQGYQRKNGLGYFGKSRLINSLQWKLIENGYDADAARSIGFEIARRIAAPNQKAA